MGRGEPRLFIRLHNTVGMGRNVWLKVAAVLWGEAHEIPAVPPDPRVDPLWTGDRNRSTPYFSHDRVGSVIWSLNHLLFLCCNDSLNN